MGDNLFRATHADPQPEIAAHPDRQYENSVNVALVFQSEEEPYTIKCICGFIEDDGNTVLCEHCNTWQHIQCYYFPGLIVPEVHQCIDCLPRILDATGASQRQRRLLEPLNAGDDRKPKRSGIKGGRKSKVKEPSQANTPPNSGVVIANPPTPVNGLLGSEPWGQDHKSGSPRDYPPPNKRLKTLHKHHLSLGLDSSFTDPQQTKTMFDASKAVGITSPPRVPLAECPPNYFSPDFIRTHQTNTEFTLADANLYLDIGVSNILSSWLDDLDLFAAATNGRTHEDVFQHFPQPIEELESPIMKRVHCDTSVEFHGGHPTWPYVTVEKDLFTGDLVGELRGSIGLQDDYKTDPANRWEQLRHPDHFVFFHPILPIYIDCRSEGTLLRYARRSCRPNMKLETIITGAREYRFCLTATTDIPAGSEITIAWDTGHDQQLQESLSGASHSGETGKDYVRTWVETILAHFGGCACEKKQLDSMCWMAYFDRRLGAVGPDKLNVKALKPGRRRFNNKRSPTSTGRATNSRASSEALTYDHQDHDMEDHMSSSRSGRSISLALGAPDEASSVAPELSGREKRKLMQQEKLFDKLEAGEHQGHRRKKRSSASQSALATSNTVRIPPLVKKAQMLTAFLETAHGPAASSNLNPITPFPTQSRDNTQARSMSLSNSGATTPGSQDGTVANVPKCASSLRANSAHISSPRPTYANASTQTSIECEQDPATITMQRKPYRSLSQRLLQRSAFRGMQPTMSSKTKTSLDADAAGVSGNPLLLSSSEQANSPPLALVDFELKTCSEDVDMMDDTRSLTPAKLPSSPLPNSRIENDTNTSEHPTRPVVEHPDPPWTNGHGPYAEVKHTHRLSHSARLRVDLPQPPLFSSTLSSEPAIFATPGALQYPSHLSPSGPAITTPSRLPAKADTLVLQPTSVAGIGVTQPSPVKKKMSLSDYMNKRKSETPATEKTLVQPQQSGSVSAGFLVLKPSLSEIVSDGFIGHAGGTDSPHGEG